MFVSFSHIDKCSSLNQSLISEVEITYSSPLEVHVSSIALLMSFLLVAVFNWDFLLIFKSKLIFFTSISLLSFSLSFFFNMVIPLCLSPNWLSLCHCTLHFWCYVCLKLHLKTFKPNPFKLTLHLNSLFCCSCGL